MTAPAAFTLIEVLIAGGILFMCLFAILALVANGLRGARVLQQTRSDPRSSITSIVYYELSHTNTMTAGDTISGEFEDYRYEAQVELKETNGLCSVDILIYPPARDRSGGYRVQMLKYLPQLKQGGPGR
jgi:hypothetical protein